MPCGFPMRPMRNTSSDFIIFRLFWAIGSTFYPFYTRSQCIETMLDIFIAPVDLRDIVYTTFPICTHGSDKQGNPCTNIGAAHPSSPERLGLAMTYDNGAVGVAKDDLGAHVNELINKKQPALKHFLVEKHAALACVATVMSTDSRSGVSPGHGASASVMIEPSINDSI